MAVDVLHKEVGRTPDFEGAAKKLLDEDPSLMITVPQDLDAAPRKKDGPGEESDAPTDPALLVPPPPAATVLRAAARCAGRAIYDAAQSEPRLSGMGTTLTAMIVHKERAHFVHVGDSRAFLYRDGKISQVTEDHSWIAEQVKAGVLTEQEARESKFRHIITRSVGFEREVEVDVLGVSVAPGDCFLLCSDGMSNFVDTEELGRILLTTWYSKVPQLLVDLANDRGGDDNITVVLVYVANDASDGA
jgi:protein phosphatase